MVEIWPDLVVFGVFSVVFAETYRRILTRILLRRILRAVAALEGGEDTADARLLRVASGAALRAAGSLVLAIDKEGKAHLTPQARAFGGHALQAIGELVKVKGAGPGGHLPGSGLDLGALDLDQLASVAIGQLPKKQQGLAALVYGIVKPMLGGLAGKFGAKGSGSSENPFLKELQP